MFFNFSNRSFVFKYLCGFTGSYFELLSKPVIHRTRSVASKVTCQKIMQF